MYRCQTDSGALEIFWTMQALKYAKQLIGIFHAEAHSVVANKNHRLPVFLGLANFNYGGRTRAGIFKCISDKVLKDLPDQSGITFHKGKVCNLPFHESA